MNETVLSTVFGVSFALVGGATVWLMLQATARMKAKGASARLIQAHRIGGAPVRMGIERGGQPTDFVG